MINLNKARVLHYKPRNTQYRVIHHDTKIKQPDGSWELGCMYTSRLTDDDSLYTRPYSRFNENTWEIVE
ncbi:conserved hypothetical protein [Vibrio phage 193E37-1]|nr:conserved hypothetical protein [Vibrio phage 193E37-1]